MNEELRQAVADMEFKQQQYMVTDVEFEQVAYYEMLAAREKVDVLVREQKQLKKQLKGIVS